MDLFLAWPNPNDNTSGDFQIGPDGDLKTVTGPTETMQRLIRRLLSNPRQRNTSGPGFLPPDDTFHPNYGAAAGRYLGKRAVHGFAQLLRGVVMGVFGAEPGVAQQPPPTVTVTPIAGGFSIAAAYTDAASSQRVALPVQTITTST